MIDKILDVYKEVYSFTNNFIKHFRKTFWVLVVIILLVEISILIAINRELKLDPTLFIITFVIPVFTFFILLIREKHKVITDVYKCKDQYEVFKIFKKNFEKQVGRLGINLKNAEQLDYLIELIEQRALEAKPRSYIKTGIIAGILGPIWVNYCSALFKFANNIDEATIWLFTFLALFLSMYFFIFMMKAGVIDDIRYSDYNKLIKIRNIMKDYRLLNMNNNNLPIT